MLKKEMAAAKLLQSCPTLCNPIDGSPLGSSVSGILQARILEWAVIEMAILLPGKSHGQRSLRGYSPWCCMNRHNLATKPPPPPHLYVCVYVLWAYAK